MYACPTHWDRRHADFIAEVEQAESAASERYPVRDWQYEVANGDTRLGYDEWLNVKIDQEEPGGAWAEVAAKDQAEREGGDGES